MDRQHYDDEREVCRDCLSGVCCESEDPIYLTSFDLFRLSAFFNVGPADFLQSFTQERFGDSRDARRRELIDDPKSSIVTYLRRRENSSSSPCIFLKYVQEADGTPRRICCVYDARPLACREFYFDTCKQRVSGELAALLAEGYEQVRDGIISEASVHSELEALRDAADAESTLSQDMRHWFLLEMRRALNREQANAEGSNSFNLADFQDPIEEKLDRVLSATHLRFEERYGPRPRNEQLAQHRTGASFAGSPELQRIVNLIGNPPSNGLYARKGGELRVGVRTLLHRARHVHVFAPIPQEECDAFIAGIPPVALFPSHDQREVRDLSLRDVYRSVLKGYNHLIRFTGYLTLMGKVVEDAAPGEVESELLQMIAGFETSLDPFIARNLYFEPVKRQMAEATATMLEKKLRSLAGDDLFGILRIVTKARAAITTLGPELKTRLQGIEQRVYDGLEKGKPERYVALRNPIDVRRREAKRLNSGKAWKQWRRQVLDFRYAAEAGLEGIDLDAFYKESVDCLERLQLRGSYAEELWEVVAALADSMSFHQTISYNEMSYGDTAGRLAAYAVRLSNYLDENFYLNREIICSIAVAYKSLGIAYDQSQLFGAITQRILASQLPDGSWDTDPLAGDRPDYQEDYLRVMYRATWECVDALRPMRSDLLNAEDSARGLV